MARDQRIILKSERDMEAMRPACRVAGAVLEDVAAFVSRADHQGSG